MAKFQRNLNYLKIIRCQISYDKIDQFLKVRALRLIVCLCKPKRMESIAKLCNITNSLYNRFSL
jgi:hypothetical protein